MAAKAVFTVFAVLSVLFGTSHSLGCASQKFSNNRVFSNCSDLPQLAANLHYTYDASNSSLHIAFIATPAPGGAWISWAINPISTGMIGCQALIAMKLSDGKVVAKTYNISGYRSIVESKLSFDVWNLSAEESNGTMMIFASMKVPVNATSLNQVWQVGGTVDGTRPSIHPLGTENKESMSKLMLVSSGSDGSNNSTTPAPEPNTPSPPSSGAASVFGRAGFGGVVSGLALLVGGAILS